MKIHSIEVSNFRSIRRTKLYLENFTCLLGSNNHGKSNIMKALEFALTVNQKPGLDEFFAHKDAADDALWVELVLSDLIDAEAELLGPYFDGDGFVTLRKTATIGAEGEPITVAYAARKRVPTTWWLKPDAVDVLTTRTRVEEALAEAPALRALLGGGRITKAMVLAFQDQYSREHAAELAFEDEMVAVPTTGRGTPLAALPELIVISAGKDVSDEAQVKSTSALGRLLNMAVKQMGTHDERFRGLRQQLVEMVGSLNERPAGQEPSHLARLETSIATELSHWGVSISIEVKPPQIEQLFQMGTSLHVDDGLKTHVGQKGHGLQRAVLFALLRAWAAASKAQAAEGEQGAGRSLPASVIFAIEEPELYLHPHAQRQLARVLDEIASADQHQVLACSHSTYFVDLNKHRSIVTVEKPSQTDGTIARQCREPLFEGEDAQEKKNRFRMSYWVNPDRGEMFFAKKVVLVEGDTEKSVFPYVANEIGCFQNDISIIDCGGKFNLPLYIKVLNAFQIPYLVVHDEDPVDEPQNEADLTESQKKKLQDSRRTYRYNQEIANTVDATLGEVEMIAPDFEGLSGIPKKQGEKKGKPIAALEYLQDNGISAEVQAVVRRVFSLERRIAAVPEAAPVTANAHLA